MARKKTTEEFIAEAQEIHGKDTFDYSKTVYTTCMEKVEIICKEHGSFWQKAIHHTQGQGCPQCKKVNRNITTKSFIEKSKEKFGDAFDYSKTIFTKSSNKICVTCKKHGDLLQYPHQHLKQGCKHCNKEKKDEKTRLEFIETANNRYSEKFDYSKVIWNGNHKNVTIICSKHGEFEQMPSNHLQGKTGCPKCRREEQAINSHYTTEQFIEKAREVHGQKFNYEKTVYTGTYNDITIICPIHGEFQQRATTHLNSYGCNQCAMDSIKKHNKKSTKQFIRECEEVHGKRYDYSKISYVNAYTPIEIICKEHGSFWQTPTHHLRGYRCPVCQESKGEFRVRTYLETKGIEFEKQKTFEKCVNIKPLKFDFYLPKENVLIEFDGEQHFQAKDFFGGVEALLENHKLDRIKNKFTIENNIPMLRIKYTDLKNIEILIEEFLESPKILNENFYYKDVEHLDFCA